MERQMKDQRQTNWWAAEMRKGCDWTTSYFDETSGHWISGQTIQDKNVNKAATMSPLNDNGFEQTDSFRKHAHRVRVCNLSKYLFYWYEMCGMALQSLIPSMALCRKHSWIRFVFVFLWLFECDPQYYWIDCRYFFENGLANVENKKVSNAEKVYGGHLLFSSRPSRVQAPLSSKHLM